jgi:peptidoglycan-associated lipoprotein
MHYICSPGEAVISTIKIKGMNMNRILLSTLFLGVLAGCASSPSLDANKTAGTPESATGSSTQSNGVAPHNDAKNALAQKRSVYFGLDEYVVEQDGKNVVQNHAAYLSKNPAQKITIEGNADEQGSREYNLALGQKRAHAVKTAMQVLGVKEAQMETVSWGEERPAATGHSEEAWSKNRRADIKYAGEK